MVLVDGRTIHTVTSEEVGIEPWAPAVWDWMTTRVLPFLR